VCLFFPIPYICFALSKKTLFHQNSFSMLSLVLPGGSEWLLIGALVFLYLYAFSTLFRKVIARPDMDTATKLGWVIFFVCAPIIALIVHKIYVRDAIA
jgi:NADH:ubiquinone oxidoreductase subunit H